MDWYGGCFLPLARKPLLLGVSSMCAEHRFVPASLFVWEDKTKECTNGVFALYLLPHYFYTIIVPFMFLLERKNLGTAPVGSPPVLRFLPQKKRGLWRDRCFSACIVTSPWLHHVCIMTGPAFSFTGSPLGKLELSLFGLRYPILHTNIPNKQSSTPRLAG